MIGLPCPYEDCLCQELSEARPLKYFLHYSVQACELECLMVLILEKCNCSNWYFPGNYTNLLNVQLSSHMGRCIMCDLYGNLPEWLLCFEGAVAFQTQVESMFVCLFIFDSK